MGKGAAAAVEPVAAKAGMAVVLAAGVGLGAAWAGSATNMVAEQAKAVVGASAAMGAAAAAAEAMAAMVEGRAAMEADAQAVGRRRSHCSRCRERSTRTATRGRRRRRFCCSRSSSSSRKH